MSEHLIPVGELLINGRRYGVTTLISDYKSEGSYYEIKDI